MLAGMDIAYKIRENRLRKTVTRRGYRLVKSRRRDPDSIDYGCFMITDPWTNSVVAGELNTPYALTLDQVEEWLARDGDGNKDNLQQQPDAGTCHQEDPNE
jgi:hypothetical protein